MVRDMIPDSLSIFSFKAKYIMKGTVVKNTLCILLFLFVLVLTGKLLRYALNDDTESYTRVTFHEMYAQDNIDILFLGTSHCMHSFDPELLDEGLHQNTFNASSASQMLDGSLMILKEADKYNDIKHVYLDLFYNNSYDVHKDRTQMTSTYIISDYLKPSVSKVLYLLNASGSEHYANSFIVARRCWKKLFDPVYIRDLISRKLSSDYRKYAYTYITHPESEYAGKGYIKNHPRAKAPGFFDSWGFYPAAAETISDDYKNDLISIIDYCRKHDIELTLICAPTSDFCLTAIGDYDDYIGWVKKTADEKGIDYYDFNLCKEKYFPVSSDVFVDPVHLDHDGAVRLNSAFCSLVNGEVSYDEMFYSSYREKLDHVDPTVFGITYMDEYADDGAVARNCRIVSNRDDGLEYEITVSLTDGSKLALKDYSKNISFVMDPQWKGSVIVNYRSVDRSLGIKGTAEFIIPGQT